MHAKKLVLILACLLVVGTQAAVAEEGSFVFSKEPIDPTAPKNLSTRFAAGDSIYGLIRLPQPWTAVGKIHDGKMILAVYTTVDKKRLAAYMELRTDEHRRATHLLFDVAPALDKMTAYRDDGVFYGDAPGGIKKGACQITQVLGQLSPGKHVLEFWVLIAGKKRALGEFTIDGADFSMYGKLHEAIKQELSAGRPFPAAKMKNPGMEAKMVALLKGSGWGDVLKLHIVDKDWWLDRVAGGNTPIKSRHMAAAAAYKGPDGKHYYKICTFHEHRLLTGGFGPLVLTHQSPRVPISSKALGLAEKADDGPDMAGVATDAMPDFGDPDAVLADIERMRKVAMKKRVFVLVGQCGTAANQVKRAVAKDPEGYQPEVKRIWLRIYEAFQKIP